ncbi:translation initiation factor IF-3, mitochondrial [Oncorhynchus clarkii lewisi]|uniref:translation initiation factor IF-3, mitochondrial n=1 Tax=Oncorhynchus clarkii lewisi TaxID=490388 RepID=UPI0039B8E51C
MSSACLRWALSHASRGVCGGTLNSWRTASGAGLISYNGRCVSASLSWGWCPLSTTVDETEEGQMPKKKQDPRARATIGSIGRKIHQRHLQVINENGENMGTMHRADVLRLMDENGLKLVPLNENKDPPVYRLMTGKQIHEEQLKLREKQKAKTGPVQVKELTVSSDIGNHDLLTKLRQVQSWLDKKHHVRITLRTGRVEHTQPLDTTLEQMVQQIEGLVGFVSKPKVIRDGRAAMCILRPPSVKELREMNKAFMGAGVRALLFMERADVALQVERRTPPWDR